ncbi:hypothetical protein SAMN05216413_0718 [Ruminococcaceae bacterium KH2T8]|nr:hypothetical protein SAMN05216413_0718 [Ruminococcaceae bacterium KH2T8]
MNLSCTKTDGIETGIYVVCSDKMLLGTINSMLKRKGIMGVADAEGKMHYLVDARKNPAFAARRIDSLIFGGKDEGEDEISDIDPEKLKEVNAIVEDLLMEYGFDLMHLGTKAMMIIIRMLAAGGTSRRMTTKQLFDIAAEMLDINYMHVERNIRYAIRRSNYDYEGIKSMTIIRDIAMEAVKKLERSGAGKKSKK